MEGVSTNSLRVIAPKWSLAGDDQLLNLLQNTHQKIILKCRDVNSRLEEMASALDGAAIDLQNVNNKFMALSNSQFIESRVYDDDADVTVDTRPLEVPSKPSPTDEISMLKASLAVVERAHETAEILDDSDTDSDTEISVVLKPKDMYSHRPLPHIIGTQAWKNKWHAGLVEEDSDTDSSMSKQDRDNEQYSDSEEEMIQPPLEEQTLSESSSSLPGSLGGGPGAPAVGPVTAARPADVAAALARRLAGDSAPIPQEEREEYPPTALAQPRKVYKPEVPASGAIFSDEPPPQEDLPEQSSEEDIFAEINKHTPYTQKSKVQNNLAEDLFSFETPAVEGGDIFSDFANTHVEKPSVKPKSNLFDGESEPELFAEPPTKKETHDTTEKEENSTKKPVGGISLFGSNKGAESIGAAILKRNQRKLSSSGDESGSDDVKTQTNNIKKQILESSIPNDEKIKRNSTTRETMDETDNQPMAKKEKDIFDDLFSKPEKLQKKAHVSKEPIKATPVKEKVTAAKETEKTNIKDLFSDNLFDDIDEIFTSNITIPAKESNKKSIFDDDDLFSEIDAAKTANPSKYNKDIVKDNKSNEKYVKDSKSIFDSDDELFSESKTNTDKPLTRNIEPYAEKNNFTGNEVIGKNVYSEVVTKTNDIKNTTETNKEGNFLDSTQTVKSDTKSQSKNIFDSDSDDDIFTKLKTPDAKKINNVENVIDPSKNDTKTINEKDLFKETSKISDETLLSTENIKANQTNVVQSPSLFEEDEIDDLFITANKLKTKSNERIDSKLPEIENILSEESVLFSENITKVNEINHSTKTDNMAKNDLTEDAITTESALHLDQGTLNKLDPDSSRNILFDKNDTFDDNLLEKDLFSTNKGELKNKSIKKIAEISEVIESSQDITEIVTKKIESHGGVTKQLELENDIITIKQYGEENVKQYDLDEISESAKEEVGSTELEIPIPSADVFGDIITEPPAFEKPAEPKKSKNINALFDDDSDDESLFFKKDDAISDEKPEIFSKNANFDIFVDEPPAIDVDFATKPARNTDIDDDLFSNLPILDNLLKSSNTAKRKEDIFSNETEEKSGSKITDNIVADDGDELFNALPRKNNVPKFIDIDNNVPVTQEVVPDNVRKEIISDNKPKVLNKVSENKSLSYLFAENEDKDLFSPEMDKSTDKIVAVKTNILSKVIIESHDELFANLPDLPTSSQKSQNKSDQNLKTDEFEDVLNSNSPKKDAEIKKIGKLNTKNFNINVNALMPGASPKKIPKEDKKSEIDEPEMVKIISDETDFTLKDKDDVEVTNQQELKTEKSVTFNGKIESGVLDNNVSKQRPKIQVKRRPSTRKARHEAVRKSAIDFGDDTDNSSSFDEPKPRNDNDLSRELNKYDKRFKEDNTISKENNHSIECLQKTDNPDSNDKIEITKKYDSETHKETHFEEKSDIFESILTNLPPHKDSVAPSISRETEHTEQNVVDNESKQKTTKIVYILNDEDIFNTESKTLEETKDMFKSTEGIKTLGNTYKDNTEKKNKEESTPKTIKERMKNKTSTEESLKNNKSSLFDDSDEELFNKNKKPVKNTTIFDSDSEEDLFSGKKSSEKKNKEVRNREEKERKEVVVKGSLFGDDDDDDDLFGVSVKKDKIAEPKQSSTSLTSKETSSLATTASKSAEPVFEDPLSMLGDDF